MLGPGKLRASSIICERRLRNLNVYFRLLYFLGEGDVLKVVLHKYDKRKISLTEYNVLYSRVYARVSAVGWKGLLCNV